MLLDAILWLIISFIPASESEWCSNEIAERACYDKSERLAPPGDKDCWRIDESYTVLRCCEYPKLRQMWCTDIEDPCNRWVQEEWQHDEAGSP